MMNTPARCALIPGLLLAALATGACDRRDQQPRQASGTTDTVILDPQAGARTTGMDRLPPPATSPCAGLSGRAEAECRARERTRRAADAPPPSDARTGDEAERP